jgi:hypothetical protein
MPKSCAFTSSSAAPVGIVLGKGITVGARLGEGAQCAVHAVHDDSKSTTMLCVVKCAPLPPPRKNPKAKPKPDEINANSLNKEFHLDTHLLQAQGSMIPVLRREGLPGRGREEVDGTTINRTVLT